jgi:hypothetical protein
MRHTEYYFMNLIMNDQLARTNVDTVSTEPTDTHDSFKNKIAVFSPYNI